MTLELSFPADYDPNPDLAGAAVTFDVTIIIQHKSIQIHTIGGSLRRHRLNQHILIPLYHFFRRFVENAVRHEDGLIGTSVGETVTLELSFPADYDPNPDAIAWNIIYCCAIVVASS